MTPNGNTLGATGGAETVTLTAAQTAAHTHPLTDPGHTHASTYNHVSAGSGGGAGIEVISLPPVNIGTSTTGITMGTNTPADGAHLNVQPTLLFNYIIKT
jgi:microcystin-dependent protein